MEIYVNIFLKFYTSMLVVQEALQEAEKCFEKHREDYHSLRAHADLLEALLRNNGIDYPDF